MKLHYSKITRLQNDFAAALLYHFEIYRLQADKTALILKKKEYCEKLRKEKIKNILAVAISYDSGKKEHQCLIEDLRA